MNRFSRKFLILPLIFFTFAFHVGLIVGCFCTAPRPGQEIEIVIVNQDKKVVELKNYTDIFKKLLVDVNTKWFWRSNKKKAPLIQEIESKTPRLLPGDIAISNFTEDYFSARNNYFRRFVFHTQLDGEEGDLPEFVSEGKLKTTPDDLKIAAYFYLIDEDKYWELKMVLSQFKVIASEKENKISRFDLTSAKLEITDISYDQPPLEK